MRGVRQLLAAPARLSPPSAGLEPFLYQTAVQAERGKESRSWSTIAQQPQDDVLGTDRIMSQSDSLNARTLERTLGVGAERVRIDPRCRMRRRLTQSGLASSISMMGMPSSMG
jgi:hypothetical protein